MSSKLLAFGKLFRINRTVMVAIVTGSGACVANAPAADCLVVALAGWCLAVAGFSLDLVADRHFGSLGPCVQSRHNPFADGDLNAVMGIWFALFFLALSAVILAFFSNGSFLYWALILTLIFFLAIHFFERPFMRGLSLGLLQALFFMMGAVAGRVTLGVVLLAAMFFFAMFGGKGMTDIRDFPQDVDTGVSTFPKRYGTGGTVAIVTVCLLIALALSLAAYFTGEFSPVYLYLDIAYIVLGVTVAVVFAAKPTPKAAGIMVYVCTMGLGSVISAAMILGKVLK